MKREAYQEMFLHEDHHWWFVARRKILQRILDRFTPKSSVKKVLEIGCGFGGNLSMLSGYGALNAMEYDDDARAAAAQRHVCQVQAGSLPDNLPYKEKFDLICTLDVVEHIDEDAASIQSMEKLLNPGGTLLVTVPAYQFLWSAHDVANNHKRRYTKSSLRALLKNTRFSVVYCSYFNTFLFPSVLLARALNNLRGKEDEFDVNMPSPLINNFLATVFSAERLFLPAISFPFGVSLVLVARRPT